MIIRNAGPEKTKFLALLRLTCYRALALWVMQATPTWAAERVILGNVHATTLTASNDPRASKVMDELRQKVASVGAVRIIVGVRAAFAPEGLMVAANVTQQRNEIAAAHSAVLNKVPSLKQKPATTKRFETIPFMALEVTPAELEALANLTEITSIEVDRALEPHLAESATLIGSPNAWASGFTGAGQTVAILDTGVDKTHAFLTGKVVSEACYSTNYASGGVSTLCPGGATSSTAVGSAMPYASAVCPIGECEHGTHVAGIAAGNNSSFFGVAKSATVIAVQVFSRFDAADSCGGASPCVMSYTSDQIRGLERVYALRSAYSIAAANMSLGGGSFGSQSACDSANTSIKTAIDNLRAVNIATVISSGNDGYTNSMASPGCISSAISVGATWDAGAVDSIAGYSNSAWFLSVLAPGSSINSSITSGRYAAWQGTSMAAPHVAGAWALLKQKAPTATVNEVLAALSSTGVSVLDTRNGVTSPRVSVSSALGALTTGVTYALSVTKAGAGSGSVSSSPAGINCGASCSASFASGSLLTLIAAPIGSGVFTGWSGACTGTGACSVSMSAARSVTATFAVGTTVTPISFVNLSGTTSSTQRFSVTVPARASNLVIQTSGGTGDVDLYVRASAQPTTLVFDCAPYFVGNSEACAFTEPLATTYYIMLNAYTAYSGVSLTVSYTSAASTNPGVLNFTSSSLTVMENAGNATVTVSRTGGADGAASVLYGTTAGTATAGVDYMPIFGNLTWASGDASSKTVSIPIINNTVVNSSPRLFSLNLSSVSGSALGNPSVATINITDDDRGAGKVSMEILYILLLED